MPVAQESLLRDFAIIMAAGGAALVITRWLKQPPVLGYLIAGALVGPFLFPKYTVSNVDSIRRIADLGLVVLLFTLGVELGWQRIRRVGLRVVFIGTAQVALMLWLGYQVGLTFGWTDTEAFFLGAALSMTSSAVLIKYLRDSGELYSTRGQLIIGISIVEDFLAVILLSLLAGVATTGASDARQVGQLGVKLGIFAVAALIFGTLFVPRLLRFLEKFRSPETLLLVSLGMCFGLGLIAGELGLSAAAGAFLIGTVVGDTEFSETVSRVTAPVRDMFAALFFVSIGMLVDFDGFTGMIVPTLVVATVFIIGKVIINTVITFLTGQDGRTSLQVGTGMPQLGEFSLAMVKTGSDHGTVGTALYPVVAVTTVITSFFFPFIFRSADRVSDFFARVSPPLVRQYADWLTQWLTTLRKLLTVHGEGAEPVKRASRLVLINLVIIAMLLAVSAVSLHYADDLARSVGWGEEVIGLIVGAVAITLCVPSGLVVWKAVSDLAEKVTDQMLAGRLGAGRRERRVAIVKLVQQTMLAALLIVVVIWAMPLVISLLSIGKLAAPIPIIVLVVTVLFTARLAIKIHKALEVAFRRTILGE
ncbi:MAG: cation:proton antiporter [Dehalococcoidia bacterium]|nr:cation:proton antiporter [Dehalococcoidia bacterium]